MHLLRIDLEQGSSAIQPLADPLLGGRALTAAILSQEVDPATPALSPDNLLMLATGPLAGLGICSAGRLSVGGKSPLTGGIKESNAGGPQADSLARVGYRGVVIAGAASDWSVLLIDAAGARLESAGALRGLGTAASHAALQARFGSEWDTIVIGPAGEQQLGAAAIALSDLRGQISRFAARGGLAAVMGTKRLKAILISRSGGAPAVADARALSEWRHELASLARADGKSLHRYGTSAMVGFVNALGGLPTRNFRSGQFEAADRINADALERLIQGRGGAGATGLPCMRGCSIACGNVVPDEAGHPLVQKLEYETLGLLGANLGIGDLDAIGRLNQLCNEIGLDTIEMGTTLGMAAEQGEFAFGDAAGAAALLQEIGAGGPAALRLGQGVTGYARLVGSERVPAAKGQAFSAYDPRAIKGTGVTQATSPMGADHTAGLTVFAAIDHRAPGGQVAASRAAQVERAWLDSLGLCAFLGGAIWNRQEVITGLLAAAHGISRPVDWLAEHGRAVVVAELAWNRRADPALAEPGLPAFLATEPLGPDGLVFDVPAEEMQHMWDPAL